MNDQRFYALKELKDAANKACVAAMKEWANERLDDNANFEAIQCVEAIEWLTDGGKRGYSVLICEAANSANELRSFLEGKLEQSGFDGVHVWTDWEWNGE